MSVNFLQKPKLKPHHFIIPCPDNNHRPHFVHAKALHAYSAAILAVKIFVLVFLFATFPNAAEFSTVTSNRIIELTNKARVEEGLPVLMRSNVLDESAMMKAKDMVARDYFAHNCPADGTTPWEWFKKAGYNYTFAGENLAMNFSEAEEAVTAWLASPSHRANIMNANYEEIGVAVIVGKIDGRETTIVVQHFGKTYAKEKLSENPFTRNTSEIAPKVAGTTEVSTGKAVEVTLKVEDKSLTAQIIYYAKKFFLALLVFIFINLLLTIFIRIRVQHKGAIIHTLFVILIGLSMLLLNFHFLEQITGAIKII
jgi:uncharacterized protein YkwD